MTRPAGRSRPEGEAVRRPGVRLSGLEGEGAKRGDVSRPERGGGRVTATVEAGRHTGVAPTRKKDACGRLSPT